MKWIRWGMILTVSLVNPGWADSVVHSIRPPCMDALRHEIEQQGLTNKCAVRLRVPWVGERYVMVYIFSECAHLPDRKDETSERPFKLFQQCVLILERSSYTVVEDVTLDKSEEPHAIVEVHHRPSILVKRMNQWVLLGLDNGQVAFRYAWPCPNQRCPYFLQTRVQDSRAFPDGPLRVIVAGHREQASPFLMRIYEFDPPRTGETRGQVREVDRLVPLADWQRKWLEVTHIEQDYRSLFMRRTILQKPRDAFLDVDLSARVQQMIRQHLDNAVRFMEVFLPSENQALLVTGKPFTVTHVDLNTRSFRIGQMTSFGEHIRPLSLMSSIHVRSAYQSGRNIFWLFITGLVGEPYHQFTLTYPNTECPDRMPMIHGYSNGEEICVYEVAVVARWHADTDETKWWFLYDPSYSGKPEDLNIVAVSEHFLEYAEATDKGMVLIKRKIF